MHPFAIPPREHPASIVRRRRFTSISLASAVLTVLGFCAVNLTAQNDGQPQQNEAAQPQQSSGGNVLPQQAQAELPDAPNAANSRPQQTKRILGVIPNFRAVSTTERLPAQTVKDKFITCTQDSFDYSSAFIPAALAGYSMGTNSTPEFGGGAAGYGRYLWHSAVDQTIENYMVEFVFPVLTHEDTRFYTLQNGSFLKRTKYALSRAVVTRSDSGEEVFNISEVVGAGASAGLSNLYYPASERSFSNTSKQWGIDVGIDAASFVAKEFWPDINRHLFHGHGGGDTAPDKSH